MDPINPMMASPTQILQQAASQDLNSIQNAPAQDDTATTNQAGLEVQTGLQTASQNAQGQEINLDKSSQTQTDNNPQAKAIDQAKPEIHTATREAGFGIAGIVGVKKTEDMTAMDWLSDPVGSLYNAAAAEVVDYKVNQLNDENDQMLDGMVGDLPTANPRDKQNPTTPWAKAKRPGSQVAQVRGGDPATPSSPGYNSNPQPKTPQVPEAKIPAIGKMPKFATPPTPQIPKFKK